MERSRKGDGINRLANVLQARFSVMQGGTSQTVELARVGKDKELLLDDGISIAEDEYSMCGNVPLKVNARVVLAWAGGEPVVLGALGAAIFEE